MTAKPYYDYRKIKDSVTISQILSRYGIGNLRKINGTSLRGRCPLPQHSSKDSDDSFQVSLSENVFNCFSPTCKKARGGKSGGTIIELVAAMEGSITAYDAAGLINEWYGLNALKDAPKGNGGTSHPVAGHDQKPVAAPEPPAATPPPPAMAPKEVAANIPLHIKKPGFTGLKNVNPAHPYLTERGLSAETIATFALGHFTGRSSIGLTNRIVIPVHNAEGNVLAYVGRAIDDSTPKYLFPPGFHKSLELFNLHRIWDTCEEIIAVEGFFGAIWLHQCGFKNVVALMGKDASETQLGLLAEFPKVTLLLDGDEPGRAATASLVSKLAYLTHVRAIVLPDNRQPDSLTADELKGLING